ncbi:MAG: septation protein IspZ [Vannielia sp.]|uniref:inner membrane-spanning protein YciB n=1 Tax=Vannielia sp. TaxID=2813045 RepID=UPI003B8E16E7
MAEKQVPGWVKTALEFGPVLGFFLGFFLLKGESYMLFGHEVKTFTYLTFWFVLAMVICMGALWALTGALSRMQVMTLVLVVFMGGLTVVLDNDLFLKLKPTILYAMFAGVLAIGLMRGQSYLARLMEGLLPMSDAGWLILTRRFAWFFLALALANAVIAFALSSGVWVTVKTFGLPAALFVFMMAQYPLIEKYGIEKSE